MLEKYTGWLVGTGLLVLFSMVVLPKGFQIVVDWFSPVIGVTLGPMLSIVFLIFGSALMFPLIFASWAVSGFVSGIVARGGIKRSLVVPISVFSTMFLILGVNAYPIIGTFNISGLGSIPPPPPGTALTDLLSLPMVSDIVPGIMSGQEASFNSIIMMFISNMIVNLLIICVFSILGSLVIVRLVPRVWKKGSKPPVGTTNKVAVTALISMVLFSALPLATYASPNLNFEIVDLWSPGQPDPNNPVLPGKGVSIQISIINNGNASIDMLRVILVAHNGTAFNITTDQTLGQYNITNPIGPGEPFNFFINLNVPPMALFGSYDVDAVIEAHAAGTDIRVSREFHRNECFIVSNAPGEQGQGQEGQPFEMGVGESLSLNLDNNGSTFVTYAYVGLDLSTKGISVSQADLNNILLAGFIVKQGEIQFPLFPSEIGFPEIGFFVVCNFLGSEARIRGDQLASQFGSALNVYFTETSTLELPISKDQSVSVIIYSPPEGYTSEQALNAYLSLLPTNGLSRLITAEKILQKPFMAVVGLGSTFLQNGEGGMTGVAMTYIEWSDEGFSGTGNFYISVKNTLGFTGKITSSIPEGSVLTVSLPPSLDPSSLDVEPADARIVERTVSLEVNGSNEYDDLTVRFRARFPPSLSVTRSVQPSITSTGGVVRVTVEVTNLGSEPVANVEVNDPVSLNTYYSTLKVMSGSPVASWVLLNPNESRTTSYNLMLGSNGKYTLNPARVTYSDQYGVYSRQSETTVITSEFDVMAYLQSLFAASASSNIASLNPSLQMLLKYNLFLIGLIIIIVLPPVVELVKRTIKRKPKEPKPEEPAPVKA
jgi:uncharacterized repeat protein (TIGR01451 family)